MSIANPFFMGASISGLLLVVPARTIPMTCGKDITDDVIAVYNEHVTVISEIKKAQWQVTNYIILLIGSGIVFRQDIIQALPGELGEIIRLLVPFVVWLGGAIVLLNMQRGLERRRERIRIARTLLTPLAQGIYGTNDHNGYRTDKFILVASLGATLLVAALCGLLLNN